MRHRPFNLAIETSDHVGWLTLGKENVILETAQIGQAASGSPVRARRGSDLMPAVDALCQRHNVQPADLGELYVSTGPGSFTGLRVAMSAAKMLARFLEVRLVAVPTVDAIAFQVPADQAKYKQLAIALNFKRQTAYAAVYQKRGEKNQMHWEALSPATVLSMEALLAQADRPLALVAPALPADFVLPEDVTLLTGERYLPQSDSVWELGRQASRLGNFTDLRQLQPFYARPPEAVELWNQRHGSE